MIESLENRRHFAVTADAFHSTLYVWGDSNSNGISVEKSGSNLVVKEYKGSGVGYQPIFNVLASAVNHVRIYGYDGTDTIQINNNVTHDATIMGGRGWDWIKSGGGSTNVYGHGAWADDPSGSHRPNTDDNAADVLVAGEGNATLQGQGGNDTLHFGAAYKSGSTQLGLGGAGNDTFEVGGRRNLALLGDTGNDVFKMHASNPKAHMLGGGGADTVEYVNFGVQVYAKNDGSTQSGAFWGSDGERAHIIDSTIETMKGTHLRDSLSSVGPVGNLYGRGGNDALYGNNGKEFIDGGDGDDRIYGGSDNDTIFGQAGNDTIEGGSGNDVIYGHGGVDSLYGQNGNDTIFGGNDNDLLKGGNHNDQLFGEGGSDHLHGEAGVNLLVGGSGSDYLHAKNGGWYDTILGDNSNGSGSAGAFDIAVIDKVFYAGLFRYDVTAGVESISFV